EQHGEGALLPELLQELEILRVPRAHLKHDARRIPARAQRFLNLLDVTLIGDFHRDNPDAVLAGQLEGPRQAFFAEALEVVRAGPRLVSTHPGGHHAVGGEGRHRLSHVVPSVDRAKTCEEVHPALVESDAVVLEPGRLVLFSVAADQAIAGRDAHHAADAGQLGEEPLRNGLHYLRRSDEVDLGDRDAGAAVVVFSRGDAGILGPLVEISFARAGWCLRVEGDDLLWSF